MEGSLLSPHIANSLFGLGLLAVIPDEDILKNADVKDRNGDGISGKLNRIRNIQTGRLR